jgi:predicted lipoprotein with Yx(FWY)xxD motif
MRSSRLVAVAVLAVVLALSSAQNASATIETVSSTATKTAVLASLNGRLFFDYNGNGKQDTGEPAVSGSRIQLLNDAGQTIAGTFSDSSGDYKRVNKISHV